MLNRLHAGRSNDFMSAANHKPKDGVPSNAPEENLPFPKNCRAKLIGASTVVLECLVPSPQSCGCALRYGNAYFCFHPNRWEIASHTLALKKKEPSST
jgi:hypothetical protein